MVEKGYADTTLTDLASASDMTVSHVLYYYTGKEAVLLELCDEIHSRLLEQVTAAREDPPEERIHVLVHNLFLPGVLGRDEMGLVPELVALSTHRSELRQRLAAFSREMAAYLEDLFAETPRHPGLSAREAADIASAMWMGMFSNLEFSDNMKSGDARKLFRRTLLSLANLDHQDKIVDWSKR